MRGGIRAGINRHPPDHRGDRAESLSQMGPPWKQLATHQGSRWMPSARERVAVDVMILPGRVMAGSAWVNVAAAGAARALRCDHPPGPGVESPGCVDSKPSSSTSMGR